MLLVDVSASGAFGSASRLKNEVAAETAILAYTAVKNNDRVGLIIFSDEVERFIPPKKGSSHVWRVIREILAYKPDRHTATDLASALEFLGKVVRRRSVTFDISDFLDDGFSDELRVLAKRHDPTPSPCPIRASTSSQTWGSSSWRTPRPASWSGRYLLEGRAGRLQDLWTQGTRGTPRPVPLLRCGATRRAHRHLTVDSIIRFFRGKA